MVQDKIAARKLQMTILMIINILLIIIMIVTVSETKELYSEKEKVLTQLSELNEYISSRCAEINIIHYDISKHIIDLNKLEGRVKYFYNTHCYMMFD